MAGSRGCRTFRARQLSSNSTSNRPWRSAIINLYRHKVCWGSLQRADTAIKGYGPVCFAAAILMLLAFALGRFVPERWERVCLTQEVDVCFLVSGL